MSDLTTCNAWQQLGKLAHTVGEQHMRDAFANDPKRAARFSASACGIHLDFSKNRIDQQVMQAFDALLGERQVAEKRDAMFSGEAINHTEARAVLHTALRNQSDQPVWLNGQDVMPEIRHTQARMQALVDAIHSGQHLGYTGQAITDVVSIGIGGSFLGPKIVTESLKPYWLNKVRLHFVANVDGCHIQDVLGGLDHRTTLVLMSSKSFSTQETLQNTQSAKQWFLQQGANQQDIAQHFVAISSNVAAATEFGIARENILPMWDWVGGRYSLWSAIGLPIALAVGYDKFNDLLNGAHAMDTHFQQAPFTQNLPMIMAMLGIWYRNFFAAQSHVLLPYYHYLRGFPAYVQQLDMESNGKAVAGSGPVAYPTGPVIFGSEGTNGQHSFHQLIHQSNTLIPADFMLPLKVPQQDATHHAMLAANCFGQSQALMQGKSCQECYQDLADQGVSDDRRTMLAQHKTMPGNKPSNTLLFTQLDPFTLGALIALYEHKVFVQGAVWGVNSFDQWGVELGKALGNKVLTGIQGSDSTGEFDASTAALINAFKTAQQ